MRFYDGLRSKRRPEIANRVIRYARTKCEQTHRGGFVSGRCDAPYGDIRAVKNLTYLQFARIKIALF